MGSNSHRSGPPSAASTLLINAALTFLAMFAVGASRALIANVRWLKAGFEMLGLGAVVAGLAYGSGAIVAAIVGRA